ncbi:MAG: hypothetical protein AB7G12_07215 [Thermoanaerobaculia bacterium]
MRPLTKRFVLILAILRLAVLTPTAQAVDGDPDPSFDGDGILVFSGHTDYWNNRAIVAPDGAEVVVGDLRISGSRSIYWRRVDVGGAAAICNQIPSGVEVIQMRAATFDSQGRLLLLADFRLEGETSYRIAVYRYLYPSCELDTSFAGDGLAIYSPAPPGYSTRRSAGISTGRWANLPPLYVNRIFVVFSMDLSPSSPATFVLRLRENGTIDTGFGGGDGILPVGDDLYALGIERTLDGRYLVAALSGVAGFDSDAVVRRYDHEGTLDTGFGVGGTATLDLSPASESSDELTALRVGPDGRIWLAGRTYQIDPDTAIAALAVLTSQGQPDASFSGDGRLTFSVQGAGWTRFTKVAAQGDGRVVLTGGFEDPSLPGDYEVVAVRFGEDGNLDPGFGSGGVRAFALDSFPGADELGTAIDLRPDGRIWVAGWTDVGLVDDPLYQPFVFLLTNSYIFADGFERGSTGAW